MTELKLHKVGNAQLTVAPGVRYRSWMESHAYRCLPLASANSFGWDILAPEDIRATLDAEENPVVTKGAAYPHFGAKTITLEVGYIWKTEPGVHLMVVPVPNFDCVGWYPLSAVIETDVLNYPWFITLRLTGGDIFIPEGSPICRVVPIRMEMIANSKITILPEPENISIERMSLHRERDNGVSWTRFYHDRAKHHAIKAAPVIDMVPGDGPAALLASKGVHFVVDLLTPDECAEVTAMWGNATRSDDAGFWQERSRWPELKPSNLTDKLTKFIEAKASSIYGETLYQRGLNLTRWGEGDEMTPHTDHGASGEFPGRKYAAVVFLTGDYEGGSTYFPTIGAEVRCNAGTLMLFPGGSLLHGVNRVLRGVRMTAISWLGPTIPQK